MNLPDVIEKLMDIKEELEAAGQDPATVEMMVGSQPYHPIAGVVLGIVNGDELELTQSPLTRNTVWMVSCSVSSLSERSPYAPRALWEMV